MLLLCFLTTEIESKQMLFKLFLPYFIIVFALLVIFELFYNSYLYVKSIICETFKNVTYFIYYSYLS